MQKVDSTEHVYHSRIGVTKMKKDGKTKKKKQQSQCDLFVFKGFDNEGKIKSLTDFYRLYQEVHEKAEKLQKYAYEPLNIVLQSVDGSDKVGIFLTIDILIRRFINFEQTYKSHYFKINICEILKRLSRFQYGLVRNFEEYLFIYGYMYMFLKQAQSQIVESQKKERKEKREKESLGTKDIGGTLEARYKDLFINVKKRLNYHF